MSRPQHQERTAVGLIMREALGGIGPCRASGDLRPILANGRPGSPVDDSPLEGFEGPALRARQLSGLDDELGSILSHLDRDWRGLARYKDDTTVELHNGRSVVFISQGARTGSQ
jgi:hypothetical protein